MIGVPVELERLRISKLASALNTWSQLTDFQKELIFSWLIGYSDIDSSNEYEKLFTQLARVRNII